MERDKQKVVDFSRAPEVIEKTDFLKAFMTEGSERDKLIEQAAYPMTLQMKRNGAGWDDEESLMPFLFSAMSMKLFNPQLGPDQVGKTMRDLIFIGYELGNFDDLNTVYDRIVDRLFADKFFNEQQSREIANFSDKFLPVKYGFIEGLFRYGLLLRHKAGGLLESRILKEKVGGVPEKLGEGEESPKLSATMESFLDTLDLSSL